MSDSSNSARSSSSSYSSDGSITCSLAKTYDPLSSSDDPDDETKAVIANFPTCHLEESEMKSVLNILTRKTSVSGPVIVPNRTYTYINTKKPHIGQRIRDALYQETGWGYISPSLICDLRASADVAKPKNAICDVCLFLPKGHVMILTFTNTGALYDNIQKYNVALVNIIVDEVQKETGVTLSIVHGVVLEASCQTSSDFRKRLDEMEFEAQFLALPGTLKIDTNRFQTITRVFLNLLNVSETATPEASSTDQQYKQVVPEPALEELKLDQRDLVDTAPTEVVDIRKFRMLEQEVLLLRSDVKILKWQRGEPDHDPTSSDTGFETATEGLSDITGEICSRHIPSRMMRTTPLTGVKQYRPPRTKKRVRKSRLPSFSSSITTDYNESAHDNTQEEITSDTDTLLFDDPGEDNTSSNQAALQNESKTDICSQQGLKRTSALEVSVQTDDAVLASDTQTVDCTTYESTTLTDHMTFFEACRDGNIQLVKYIISRGTEIINAKYNWGYTPVMIAMLNGQAEVFDILVRNGADLSVLNDDKHSILDTACYRDNVGVVKYLLALHTFDINSKGQWGRTPVMHAAIRGCMRVFQLLVSNGADLSVTDDNEDTVLNVAALRDNVDFVKYLLTLNIADINVKGFKGRPPVMHAANKGCREVFELLVKWGADHLVVDNNKNTVLNVACLRDNVDFVRYLLRLKVVDINVRGFRGRTPIMQAASSGSRKVFDLLMNAGADLSMVDDDKNTVLNVACLRDNEQFVDYLLTLKIVDINVRGRWGRTPVMQAASSGRERVFDLLVYRGADLTMMDYENSNNILHLACMGGNVKIVEFLIFKGKADVNSMTRDGQTPAQLAIRSKRKEELLLLVERGHQLKE